MTKAAAGISIIQRISLIQLIFDCLAKVTNSLIYFSLCKLEFYKSKKDKGNQNRRQSEKTFINFIVFDGIIDALKY